MSTIKVSEAAKKPTWQHLGYDREVLVNNDGRIIGEISGGFHRFYAFAKSPLGAFIDASAAKRAVERALRIV